jgi:hypothetical protein
MNQRRRQAMKDSEPSEDDFKEDYDSRELENLEDMDDTVIDYIYARNSKKIPKKTVAGARRARGRATRKGYTKSNRRGKIPHA